MSITKFLEKNALLYPNDIALVEINSANYPINELNQKEFNQIKYSYLTNEYKRELTWSEFNQNANKLANLLINLEIKKGDKVAILLKNCLEWLQIYFGILKTGAIAVPMSYRYSSDEICHCLNLADIKVLIFESEFFDCINECRNNIKFVKGFIFVGVNKKTPKYALNYYEQMQLYSNECPTVSIEDNDPAAIYFSSGTTGFPKAILHSHKGLIASAEQEVVHYGRLKNDVLLCIAPLYHTGTKMHWLGSLATGTKAVLLCGVNPKWLLRCVSTEQCTIVALLVPWAQDILDAIDKGYVKLEDYKLNQWRLMHLGAQPIPPSLIARWKKIFPYQQYDTIYGLTESLGPGCVHLGVENIHKAGSIGKAGYKWETTIVNDNFEEVKQGEIGELAVKGPGIMIEYYKNPEATNKIMHGEWLLTGDIAKVDEEGFIYLIDRKKDVIISGGENLYPVQIENFLRAYDKIKDAAVIGLSDQRLGEIAVAIIEIKPEMVATEEEINKYCQELPRYKRPKRIIFAKIPRNSTGKIEKSKLRKLYSDT